MIRFLHSPNLSIDAFYMGFEVGLKGQNIDYHAFQYYAIAKTFIFKNQIFHFRSNSKDFLKTEYNGKEVGTLTELTIDQIEPREEKLSISSWLFY